MAQTIYAVIGAGHGGQTVAAYLSMMGCAVRLYNRTASVLDEIRERGGISLEGNYQGQFPVERLCADIGDAVGDADVILITTPADAHYSLANIIAPHLRQGQTIILIPGRTGGVFEFSGVLQTYGKHDLVTVGETDTFIFTCRSLSAGVCKVFGEKQEVLFSTDRPERISPTLALLEPVFPMLVPVTSVWHTGLSNIGAIFHPTPVVLNIARIEQKSDFLFYREAISPMVARYLERIDAERLAIAARLGIQVKSAMRWLFDVYGARGTNLYAAIQQVEAYGEVTAPTDPIHRYVFEDVCTGLVPMSAIGSYVGTPTPAMDRIIAVAGALYEYEFMHNGRNLDRMPLARPYLDECAGR